ncbi:MAG TPA: FtsX-like permease family protein, partial [Gemmatimonadetes bacterium]|nr:FtsX-like permease family protein [Gemmatimonadota bacterium]
MSLRRLLRRCEAHAECPLTVFAAIALLLSGVGLHGTMAFAVGRRRREFGIRLALGAEAPDLVRVVVARGLAITGAPPCEKPEALTWSGDVARANARTC